MRGDQPVEMSPAVYARRLAAQLLEWHNREAKPEWWEYFNRLGMDERGLLDDNESIGGLVYDGEKGRVVRSVLHGYRFDPAQEHKLHAGARAIDPATTKKVEIVELDPIEGTLLVRRGKSNPAPHPLALIPGKPFDTKDHREALMAFGRVIADGGPCRSATWTAAHQLLLREPPCIAELERGADTRPLTSERGALEQVAALAVGLDHSYLPVQGPPGSGKTHVAARVIVRLVAAGKRVAVTAQSHAVITNLLNAVIEAAQEAAVTVRCLQRTEDGSVTRNRAITVEKDAQTVANAVGSGAYDVVGGTAWLFTREDMRDSFDHLVIDEAGQMSLANLIAVSGTADNLILVGDPQQLSQPSKGSHPPGAEVSALEYVLDGQATVPARMGIFLDRTFRLHPDICHYVSELAYAGELRSDDGCAQQRVHAGHGGADWLTGSGLRWSPVEHQGNRTSSTEEAQRVASIYGRLLGRSWTDRQGLINVLGPGDILIVAPYNAQVIELHRALPDGAKVGTVDKFQGQEAAVVIVSMAASSAHDVPRGMEFLYSMNRLNVAVSRAKALCIMVASPELLDVRCRTLAQIELANGLAMYAEMASPEPSPSDDGGGDPAADGRTPLVVV